MRCDGGVEGSSGGGWTKEEIPLPPPSPLLRWRAAVDAEPPPSLPCVFLCRRVEVSAVSGR